MVSGIGGSLVGCGKSDARITQGVEMSEGAPGRSPLRDAPRNYCLMTQTRISGFTSACSFTGTR